jgi:hypothetical protein
MNEAIEVVIFKAKAGVTDSQLQTAALAITPILSAMPGFISRDLGESEDGRYMDVIHWQDLESAETAAEKVMTIPQCIAFFDLIDQSHMQFMHFTKII